EAFPTVYRDRFGAAEAAADVAVVESLLDGGEELAARLYRTSDMPADRMRIKLYLAGRQLALTDALPLLENLGVRVEEELPFGVKRGGGEAGEDGARTVWIHDFALVARGESVDFDTAKPLVEATLRAYSRYLRQAGMTFSQTYIANTMVQHRELAKLLVRLFCTRFDPAQGE